MSKIGIFFGTDTGSTRLVAKKIYSLLGEELADKPKNINRASPEDLLKYDALILGTPSYGIGDLPGLAAGCQERSWREFVGLLDGHASPANAWPCSVWAIRNAMPRASPAL